MWYYQDVAMYVLLLRNLIFLQTLPVVGGSGTLLHAAVALANVDAVRTLLNVGASADVLDNHGR